MSWRIALAVALILLLAGCARKPDEQRIRDAVSAMQAAMEGADPHAFMSHVTTDFTGNDGTVDRDGLANLLRVVALRNQKIGVTLGRSTWTCRATGPRCGSPRRSREAPVACCRSAARSTRSPAVGGAMDPIGAVTTRAGNKSCSCQPETRGESRCVEAHLDSSRGGHGWPPDPSATGTYVQRTTRPWRCQRVAEARRAGCHRGGSTRLPWA